MYTVVLSCSAVPFCLPALSGDELFYFLFISLSDYCGTAPPGERKALLYLQGLGFLVSENSVAEVL